MQSWEANCGERADHEPPGSGGGRPKSVTRKFPGFPLPVKYHPDYYHYHYYYYKNTMNASHNMDL